uniref:Porin n=1 Tax=Thermodesulfobacterium geofontis TaxID=1295609 RepID=A0A7V5XFF5_9BACT
MRKKLISKVLLPSLIMGGVFVKTSLAEENPEELKAQIETLKQQIAVMQQQMASMQALIENLQGKVNQVETKTEKLTPQFVAKESKPVFGRPGLEWQLYGRVKMDYHYDTAQIVYYNDFVGAVKNRWSASYKDNVWEVRKVKDYQNDSTNFNPRDTRLGTLVYQKRGDWIVKGHTEIDFYGYNSGNNIIPRMRLAYVDIHNSKTKTSLLFGQDWIPVSQLNPSTIEFGILTAAGNLWWRVPQLTIRQKVFENWELLGSLMMHRRIATSSEERMPWALARVQYKDGVLSKIFDKGSMIAIGGGYKHDAVEPGDVSFPRKYFTTESDVDRWLLVGEWVLNFKLFNQKFQFKGEAWTGKGIDKEWLRYDLGVNAYGEPIEAYGLWADLVWNIKPRLSFTIGAGFDDPNDKEILKGQYGPQALNDRQFTKNTQYFANLWYKLSDNMSIGVEVMRIETERDKWVDTANRFTLSAFYNF